MNSTDCKTKGLDTLKELMSISNVMDLRHPNLINLFGKLERELTPPTAEQVCKALSEYINIPEHAKIRYQFSNKSFYLRYNSAKAYVLCQYMGGMVIIDKGYSPKLTTMIGQFYEEESKCINT